MKSVEGWIQGTCRDTRCAYTGRQTARQAGRQTDREVGREITYIDR